MLSRLPRKVVYPFANNGIINRMAMRSATAATAEIDDSKERIASAKPFSEVPGPKGLPIIGTLLTLLKNNGYYQKRPHLLFSMYKEKYGPIFKDKIVNNNMLIISKPEDVAAVFKAEGKYPSRGPAKPWVTYREQRKKSKGVLIG